MEGERYSVTANQVWNWFVRAVIAGLVLVSLAWAQNEKRKDESIITIQAHYADIAGRLDRIEDKLDRNSELVQQGNAREKEIWRSIGKKH